MREFLSSGVGVAGLVLAILGTVFTLVGFGLAMFVRAQVLGIVFLCVGSANLTVAVLLVMSRLGTLRQRARLLESGYETPGTIVEFAENPLVRVNGRRPWVVRYRYEVEGREHRGSETMMDPPVGYAVGASVVVMYDPDRVGVSTLRRVP